MRPDLIVPADRDKDILLDTLVLAGVELLPKHVAAWTEMEVCVAFDWAMRVHLRASDNQVKVRDKPSFIQAAEDAWLLEWPVALDRQYGDLLVICDAIKPKLHDAPLYLGIPCHASLGYPDSLAQLLEEMRRHARTVPHEGRPCR